MERMRSKSKNETKCGIAFFGNTSVSQEPLIIFHEIWQENTLGKEQKILKIPVFL